MPPWMLLPPSGSFTLQGSSLSLLKGSRQTGGSFCGAFAPKTPGHISFDIKRNMEKKALNGALIGQGSCVIINVIKLVFLMYF